MWVNASNDITVKPVNTANNKYPGYKFKNTNPATIPAAVASGSTIEVYYVKDEAQTKELSYTVEYYKDGSKIDADSYTEKETVWVNASNDITVKPVDTSNGKYPGYKFESTNPAIIPAAVASGSTIKVYYVKDESQRLGYKVEYYKDGNHQEGWDYNSTVPNHTPIVDTNGVPDKTPAGYKLDEATSTKLPFEVTAENNIIKVYYVKDSTQTLSYTIEYYYDGETEPFETSEGLTVPASDPVVTSVPDAKGLQEGYTRDRAELPFTITKDENVIKVYYKEIPDNSVIIPVTHEYFTNGSRNGSQSGASVALTIPADGSAFKVQVSKMFAERIKMFSGKSYSFSKIEVRGTLKDDVLPAPVLKEEKLPAEQSPVKEELEAAKPDVSETEEPNAEATETGEVKAGDEKFTIEPAFTKEAPEGDTSSEVTTSDATEPEESKEETEANTSKENTSSEAATSDATEPEVREETTVEEESKAETAAIEKTKSEEPVAEESKATAEALPNEEAALDIVTKPKTVVHTSDFDYDPDYQYEVVITYTRSTGGSGGNGGNGGGNGNNNNPDDTVTIDDPALPLAPLPNGLVTIVDPKLPLGNLPKFGGASRILAVFGCLAIVGSVALKLKKDDDDSDED